ncbi:MAG: hypothetical protein LBR19_02445, partial [Bifidobacteriaceae bacterium]|nr:hypothetical protein [Bifidobacteriaceae bacterium]
MSNPVFGRNGAFNGRGGVAYYPSQTQSQAQPGYQAQGYPTQQGYATPQGYAGYPGYPSAEQLNQMYQAPAAGPLQTGRLTYEDVLVKTV